MSAGDEVGLTEDLYISMIGRYAAAVEVLTKRMVIKDQRISQLENELALHNEKHDPPQRGAKGK
jgi:hypothetical protein